MDAGYQTIYSTLIQHSGEMVGDVQVIVEELRRINLLRAENLGGCAGPSIYGYYKVFIVSHEIFPFPEWNFKRSPIKSVNKMYQAYVKISKSFETNLIIV